jgi:hypothetical protein
MTVPTLVSAVNSNGAAKLGVRRRPTLLMMKPGHR